jgi:predicted GNAT family N-acyltransferase
VRALLTSDPQLLADAYALRQEVFTGEQGVDPAIDLDGRDELAEHAVVLDDEGAVVATARLLDLGGVAAIGRVAVRRSLRGTGVGIAVMRVLEERALERGLSVVELHAQRAAEGFYARIGYVPFGEEYLEAGIPHVSMRKVLA